VDKQESRDPALKQLWAGNLHACEPVFLANAKQSPLAAVRYAEACFLRFWLTGDRALTDEVIKRFNDAAEACLKASEPLVLSLSPALDSLASTQPLTRRLSLKMGKAMPALASVGVASTPNPGELRPSSLEFKQDKAVLEDWKRLQGLAALCYMLVGATHILAHGYLKGSMSLRKAWQLAQKACANIEASSDTPSALGLVIGCFQLALTQVPPWIAHFLRAVGTPVTFKSSQGKDTLQALLATSDPAGETHNYARLALAAFYLLASQQEYNPSRSLQLRKADEIVSEVLQRSPDWVLFRWMRSHIVRRMGRPNDAAQIVTSLASVLASPSSSPPHRLEFDHACLLFVQRQWTAAETKLKPLVAPECAFTAKGLAFASLSACAAMRSDIGTAVDYLEAMGKLDQKQQLSKADSAWMWKLNALLHRPHKRLLMYEICYLFGYFKWFDADIAGTLKTGGGAAASDWLDKCAADLTMMHEEALVTVVYPEFPVIKEEAAEELMALALVCGHVCAMRGQLDKAEWYFKSIMDNKDTRSARDGTREDPYHVAFAHYELGSLDVRRGSLMAARASLVKALKLCRKRDFSFHHMLAFKCTGALRYISDQERPKDVADGPEWQAHKDELGLWMGEDLPPSATQAGDLIEAVVKKADKFELKRPMKPGDTITWQWTVDALDIAFMVLFTTDGGEEDEVEPLQRTEAGDYAEGFFTCVKKGHVRFVWDNSSSKFSDRKIHYLLS